MYTRKLPFSAQVRRYKHLAKKVNRLLQAGTFHLLSVSRKRELTTKLRERLRRIGHLFPQRQLKGAFAGIALLLGTVTANEAYGQTFAPAVANPFGIATQQPGYQNLADIDGDGDLDLVLHDYDYFAYERRFAIYENTGTAQAPAFTADNYLLNPYGIEPAYLSQPILVDLDSDGDLDLLSGSLDNGSFIFQENIGSATSPAYEAIEENPFGLSSPGYGNFATAADLDGDGDIDLLSGSYDSPMQYFENTGTLTSPAFAAPQENPFSLSIDGDIIVPQLGDLDGDGDYDLLYMSYPGFQIYFSENIGTPTAPEFTAGIADPFGIDAVGLSVPIPSMADMDGDSDMDVLIADVYGSSVLYYENLDVNLELPPTASDNAVTIQEDGLYLFSKVDFNFQDANAGDVVSAVQITALPTSGILKLGSVAITLNQIIQADDITNLNFDPDPNENGNGYASFDFKVYDGGLWSVDDYTMTINVTPVNDAPASQDAEVTGSMDLPLVFEAADFPYTDVEGQALAGLKILTLPAKGSLKVGSNAVTAGQNLSAAQVATLTYTPVPDEFGTAYAAFDFQVNDGSALSVAATMTINIEEPLGSTARLLQADVVLSPNPTTDLLNLRIESAQPLGQLTIGLFDAVGQKIASNELESNGLQLSHQLTTKDLAPGFYFVKIESNGKAVMKKFVKN